MWAGQSLERQKALAFDSAAGAALLCAGACFHSVQGKVSGLFTGDTLEVAQAWTAGAQSVDLRWQSEPYQHRDEVEIKRERRLGFLRCYTRGDSPFVDIRR
jgi:hypothetical protein